MLTLPLRRGISEYDSILAYEDVMKAVIDPGWRDTMFGLKNPPGNILETTKELDRRLMLNGHNPVEMNKQAISNLKSMYFGELFKAVEEEDTKQAEEAAMALVRLGVIQTEDSATARGIDPRESMKAQVYISDALELLRDQTLRSRSGKLPPEVLFPLRRYESDPEKLQELIKDMSRIDFNYEENTQ